jgi:hypothetical protein
MNTLDDFRAHLLAEGKSPSTVAQYVGSVKRFLARIGEPRIERITEELTRSYFATIKSAHGRRSAAVAVSMYLRFAASRLPAVVNARGELAPRAPAPSKLRQRWLVDKLVERKSKDDDLIAKLARKVIDGYLLGQRQIKGDVNLDDVYRYVDECRELIESNLALFMSLSAGGRNIHSAIDERVNR